jgi:hypothetical protein
MVSRSKRETASGSRRRRGKARLSSTSANFWSWPRTDICARQSTVLSRRLRVRSAYPPRFSGRQSSVGHAFAGASTRVGGAGAGAVARSRQSTASARREKLSQGQIAVAFRCRAAPLRRADRSTDRWLGDGEIYGNLTASPSTSANRVIERPGAANVWYVDL